MTQDALSTWLLANLPLRAVLWDASEIAEDRLPAAFVTFAGVLSGETLDAAENALLYDVSLLANVAGGRASEVAAELSFLELSLVNSCQTTARFSPFWNHLTCRFGQAQRGAGEAQYRLTLFVSKQTMKEA